MQALFSRRSQRATFARVTDKQEWRCPFEAPNLLRLSAEELDELFRSSEAGAIPRGEAHGTVLVGRGRSLAWPAAKLST